MQTLGMTQSVCRTCRQIVPAKVRTDGTNVFLEKFCPRHGTSQSVVSKDLDNYLATQRYVKPAWVPREHAGDSDEPCPHGCGFCERHEQHLCLPVVEITSRCDLSCPVCIADAGDSRDMTLQEYRHILDRLIDAEGQIDVLNLSGGEPLLHPDVIAFVDETLKRPEIVRVSISTNGLTLLNRPELASELHQRDVVVSLQLDGFDDRVYRALRGKPLLAQKQRILDLLAEKEISTSLTMTAAHSVNTDQFPQVVDYLFSHRHVISLMIQPLAFAGRASGLQNRLDRLTIPEIVTHLGSMGNARIRAEDFVPLPCSHPLCFSLAYYLMMDDGSSISVNQLIDSARVTDALANRTVFGLDADEQESLKDMVYDIWSGPAAATDDSERVMKTLRRITEEMSCSCFDVRKAFTTAERHIKSIFIHAFQDAETFDLSRVRRCCQAYAQPDGRLIPICVHNVLGRGQSC